MPPATPRTDSQNPSALPMGTRLGEFEITGVLGVGGFGIVYLAFDHTLEREVAVKEYMPASLAGRTETLQVSVRSQGDADTFALGLKSFVNEAKLLARFDDRSLLKVHRFWEANGTAYMVMPVLRGRTLKEVRAETGRPDEAWLRAMLVPLLGAIEKLHAEGVYHRDIAPDNIQIEPDGHPVLLDFGAARRVISDQTQTLTAILKPAYAPIEQYAEAGSVKQGPWTDLYALGATLHYLLLNRPPAPATTRAIHDEASALSTAACPGCSEVFLRTIDWMLAPRPADRPPSVAALREVLEGRATPPLRRPEDPGAPASAWERTQIVSATPPRAGPAEVDVRLEPEAGPGEAPGPHGEAGGHGHPGTRVVPPGASRASAAGAASADSEPTRVEPRRPPATAADRAAPPTAAAVAVPQGSRTPWALGLGLGVLLLVIAGVALWPADAPVATADPAASVPALAAAAPGSAPASASVPALPSRPESSIATVVVPTAPAPRATALPLAGASSAGLARPGRSDEVARPPRPLATAPAPAGGLSSPGSPAAVAAPEPAPRGGLEAGAEAARPPVTSGGPPAGPSAQPEPAAAAATTPVTPVASGPEATCAGRNPVLYFVCMERECLRGRFQQHADCVKWRAEARREVN